MKRLPLKSNSAGRGRTRAGFTLVELMVGIGIGSILMAALAAVMFYTGRSFAALTNYVDLDHKSRNALDTMSREIRQVQRLISGTDTRLTFLDWDGRQLIYNYDSRTRQLTRTKDGVPDPEPLLTECDYLLFSRFARNPRAGTYDQYPAASSSTCKLIQMRWVCSRSLIRSRWNTESVQSAKIVIRNNPNARGAIPPSGAPRSGPSRSL